MSQSDSRGAILSAIANALSTTTPVLLPEAQPVFAGAANVDPGMLARIFHDELAALPGETRIMPHEADTPNAVAKFMHDRQLLRIAAQDVPQVRQALSCISPESITWASSASKDDIAAADCGVIEAQALVADTGAVLALLPTYPERILPYLPRTCVVIAQANVLCPHLGGRALELIARAARDCEKGEAALIAGPSKSADIEKILVLGAHGPQAVVVFISGVTVDEVASQ